MRSFKINNATKEQKIAVKEIVPWVLNYLLGKKLTKNIELTIKFKKIRNKERVEGTSTWEDNNHKPREFTIEIDKEMSLESIIITLCHELVHIKQMATGEMKDLFRGKYDLLWRGSKISTKNMKIPYWDWPWEIEAFGREEGLYIMWKESKGLKPHETFRKYLKSHANNVLFS